MRDDSADQGQPRREMTVARIARLAGVSAPTVSKVLNGRTGVAVSTRQRVQEVIDRYGYVKAEHAEPFAAVELVFQVLDSPWALEIIRGAEETAGAAGLAVAVTRTSGGLVLDEERMRQIIERRPTGVVAASVQVTDRQLDQFAKRGVPVVVLDPSGEPRHQVPSVGTTNWTGGLLAARHLLELGHRRIAVVAGPERLLGCRARLDGLRAAVETAGLALPGELVQTAELNVEGGHRAAGALLGLPDRPTAVVTTADVQAVGVYRAAAAAGLRIPADLSVVGFDDLPFAGWLTPPLTTVRQPLTRMGAVAADMVVALSAGREPEHSRIELPTTLIVRDSTAPPAG